MTEHASLKYMNKKKQSFNETISDLTSNIEHLQQKYADLQEADLTVNTLTELTARLNSFEEKLDLLVGLLQENLKESSSEVELLAFLKAKT